MRLLRLDDDGKINFVELAGRQVQRYAILSHTWGADNVEVTLKDLMDGTYKAKAASSAELTEAINSMFRWYRNAAKCYVYLADVSTSISDANEPSPELAWKSAFRSCRWFTRGWTLQELLASKIVEFFTVEGERLGDKTSLAQYIKNTTGIPTSALQGTQLSRFSTSREEDAAYSLLGIFDIHLPLIYGEGKDKALKRLLKENKENSEYQRPIQPLPVPRPQGSHGATSQHDTQPISRPLNPKLVLWILKKSIQKPWESIRHCNGTYAPRKSYS
ncbi:hypothetical protein BDV95DRAFT_631490 [Massariosphaeria phaeospora]|uniref:Heterokaryon incompatibility domain-containing protein n=1 Tax=Massariosphaeria phaeospora TaxID=100035 RepID=A0A7C8I6U3_9PLEO|nr:hypothetical protein BDV95DRAFT_631490 [Massariosphaeria phaeospora]